MWHRPKTTLGIHIGEEEMSIAVLHYQKNQIELVATHCWPINSRANEQKLGKYLRAWLKENNIHTKDAFASLPAAQSMKKTCGFLKTLREEDIQIELALNQAKYFDGIQEMLLFDVVKLSPSKPEEELQNYYVFAARLSEMTWRRNILIDAGLNPLVIELDQYALLRVLLFLNPVQLSENEAAVLLDLSQGIRMVFFDRQEILLDTLSEKRNYKTTLQNFSIQFSQYTLKHVYVFKNEEQKQPNLSGYAAPAVVDIAERIEIPMPLKIQPLFLTAIGLALRGYYD